MALMRWVTIIKLPMYEPDKTMVSAYPKQVFVIKAEVEIRLRLRGPI